MMEAATNLQFERAAQLRDKIKELEKSLNDKKEELKSHIDNSVVNVVLKSLKYEIDRIEREYYYLKEID